MPHRRLQLTLPFPHDPGYAALDFLPDSSNQEALAWLDRPQDWPDRRLAVWGDGGRGKSHLLHSWARDSGFPLLQGQTLRSLDAMPQDAMPQDVIPQDVIPLAGGLVLDDADTIADECALLHLLNTARDRGLLLLLSGRTAPARWPVKLPDLSSRLRAITAVEILSPSDALLRSLLMRMVADRQLTVGDAVQDWLLLRLPRSPGALREAVARLDRESMVRQQPITRSFAAKVLDMEDLAEAEEMSMAGSSPSSRLGRLL